MYYPSFLQVNHETVTGSAGETYEVYSSKTSFHLFLMIAILLDFLINENITIYILSTSENLIMKLESTYLLRYSQKAVSP